MSELTTIGLFVASIWLGILTLVVILLVRQIGIITVRLSLGGFSVDNDGPRVGSKIPQEAISVLPQLAQGEIYILLVSATCTPCRELVIQLKGHRFEATTLALVPGSEELADGLVTFLPPEMQAVRDPDASQIAEMLQIRSTPFALAFENGKVIKKGYMRQALDFVTFVNGHGSTSVGKVSSIPKEVAHVH